jgi:hypothetical protein
MYSWPLADGPLSGLEVRLTGGFQFVAERDVADRHLVLETTVKKVASEEDVDEVQPAVLHEEGVAADPTAVGNEDSPCQEWFGASCWSSRRERWVRSRCRSTRRGSPRREAFTS